MKGSHPNPDQPPPPPVMIQLLLLQALGIAQSLAPTVLCGKFDLGNFEIEIREKAIVAPPAGGGHFRVQG